MNGKPKWVLVSVGVLLVISVLSLASAVINPENIGSGPVLVLLLMVLICVGVLGGQ